VRAVLLGQAPIVDTTAAPHALHDEIGPIVREIRRRSRVPGELSIKRDVTPSRFDCTGEFRVSCGICAR
jgi:hypothetical protein